MTAKLTKELAMALQAAGNDGLEVIDPETNRVYLIVDEQTHRRALHALRAQQDHDAIAEGIAQMEAGEGKPAEPSVRGIAIATGLLVRGMKEHSVIILPRAEEDIERNARWWAQHHDAAQAANYWLYTVRRQIS